jgi:hypothetical protein
MHTPYAASRSSCAVMIRDSTEANTAGLVKGCHRQSGTAAEERVEEQAEEREPEPAVLSLAEESETSAGGCVLLTSEWAKADVGSLHGIGCARGLEPDAA